MTVLRDPAAVALDNVALACRRAAQAHDDAASLVGELAPLCRPLAEERAAMARALEPHILGMNALPSEPDPDRSLVARAVRRLRTALSGRDARAALDELERREAELAACIHAALAEDVPTGARAVLIEHGTRVQVARERLAAHAHRSDDAPR